jgi:hypothetical protein
MGYSFTIGKASVDTFGKGEDLRIFPSVDPCEFDGDPSSVWVDNMGGDDATRCPSYSQWGDLLDQLPRMKFCFDYMERLVKEDREDRSFELRHFIPCALYADLLDGIELEAQSASPDAMKRAMWFVKWSREAIKRYGNLAAFDTPGEW